MVDVEALAEHLKTEAVRCNEKGMMDSRATLLDVLRWMEWNDKAEK